MRIIHVATLLTPTGAFGGPTNVALDTVSALRERGHDSVLVAAALGFGDKLPEMAAGAPVRLFHARQLAPTRGFTGIGAPGMVRWLRRQDADIFHFHLGRDLVTMRAARSLTRQGRPVVVQTHGMLQPSSHPLGPFVDRHWTRPVLAAARRVFYLSDLDRDGIRAVSNDKLALSQLPNGIRPIPPTEVGTPERQLLFLARLHPNKRVMQFALACQQLASEFPDWKFCIVGPDDGDLRQLREFLQRLDPITRAKIQYEGSLDPESSRLRMQRAAVYVAPAEREYSSLAVLEALSAGIPVVVSNTGIALAIERAGAGIVTDGTIEGLTEALRFLMTDSKSRERMGRSAQRLVESDYTLESVTTQLIREYTSILSEANGAHEQPAR
ncbi:glycosyltransferase [Agromyces sp. MMS24-JH15]|uniref:glycosyltransferase n=1 Tax=Agromyces sp. MMS24-JH15 TaxID=3243765 RepID=UPI0037494AA7